MTEFTCGREQMCIPCEGLSTDNEKTVVCAAVGHVASIHAEVAPLSLAQLREELYNEMDYQILKRSQTRPMPYATVNAGLASLLELKDL